MLEPDVLERVSQEIDTEKEKKWRVILWNDDVNTFEWVILSCIELCNHEPEQAEQIANLVHYKGKAIVKSGEKEQMLSIKDNFLNRSITATVEFTNES
jgi:ATP-dependent Clp protease adaptor protein ClpS